MAKNIKIISRYYKILVKDGNVGYCLNTNNIIFVRDAGGVTTFYMNDNKTCSSARHLIFFEKELLENGFIRVNRNEMLYRRFISGGSIPEQYILVGKDKFYFSDRRAKIIHEIVGNNLVYSLPEIINTNTGKGKNDDEKQSKLRKILTDYINNTSQIGNKVRA